MAIRFRRKNETPKVQKRSIWDTIREFSYRHVGSITFVTLLALALLAGISGYFQGALTREEYRWKLEMYLQGSLVIVGFLIIFAMNYNRWINKKKNWDDAARQLNVEAKEIKRAGPIKILFLLRKVDNPLESGCFKILISWAIFSLAIYLLIIVSLFSLFYITTYQQSTFLDEHIPGAITGAVGSLFFTAITLVFVFVLGYTGGFLVTDEEEIN